MRPQSVTVKEAGNSPWIPVDHHKNPFSIGFGVTVPDGVAAVYSVQHTFDDIQDPNVTPEAFDHPDVSEESASADGNYAHPVRAIRLSVASTDGPVTLTLIQAGIR